MEIRGDGSQAATGPEVRVRSRWHAPDSKRTDTAVRLADVSVQLTIRRHDTD